MIGVDGTHGVDETADADPDPYARSSSLQRLRGVIAFFRLNGVPAAKLVSSYSVIRTDVYDSNCRAFTNTGPLLWQYMSPWTPYQLRHLAGGVICILPSNARIKYAFPRLYPALKWTVLEIQDIHSQGHEGVIISVKIM